MERERQSCTTVKVVLLISVFLLSGIPNVSSQQNLYAPEVDYSCDETLYLDVEFVYQVSYLNYVTCTVTNNNSHNLVVKITTEEWEHTTDGPFDSNGEYSGCQEGEIVDEINVNANSYRHICYKLSADKYTPVGESLMTTSAEVIRYGSVIQDSDPTLGVPCNACEPVDKEVNIVISPWVAFSYDYVSLPESAYGYQTERIICDKSDFSELTLEISADGNFVGTYDLSVDFSYQWTILDLVKEDYVNYSESTFGKIQLDHDPELISLEAGESVQRTFKASWDIKENTENYDITLSTYVGIQYYSFYQEIEMYDYCPKWEGVLTTQEIRLNNDSSGVTVNLTSPFSISLSIISIVMAAVIIRKDKIMIE